MPRFIFKTKDGLVCEEDCPQMEYAPVIIRAVLPKAPNWKEAVTEKVETRRYEWWGERERGMPVLHEV